MSRTLVHFHTGPLVHHRFIQCPHVICHTSTFQDESTWVRKKLRAVRIGREDRGVAMKTLLKTSSPITSLSASAELGRRGDTGRRRDDVATIGGNSPPGRVTHSAKRTSTLFLGRGPAILVITSWRFLRRSRTCSCFVVGKARSQSPSIPCDPPFLSFCPICDLVATASHANRLSGSYCLGTPLER